MSTTYCWARYSRAVLTLVAVQAEWTWFERRGRAFPGRTFWSFALLYGVLRFIIEFFRGDTSRGFIFNTLSTSQFISVVLAPISLSIWDEPGLLIKGHDHPPMVMMGHNKPEYEAWVEAAGYVKAKDLFTKARDAGKDYRTQVRKLVPVTRKTTAA